MSPSENALLRDLYVMTTTAAGGEPLSDSLSSRRYLELINNSMGQLLANLGTGTGGSVSWESVTGKPSTYPPTPESLESLLSESEYADKTGRKTLTVTTPSLAPGAAHVFTLLTGYQTFVLANIALDAPGRPQGYRTPAARAADEGRAFGVAPIPDALELDALLIAGALSQPGAGLIGLTADGILYGRLTNTGTVATPLTMTLDILPLEEAIQL